MIIEQQILQRKYSEFPNAAENNSGASRIRKKRQKLRSSASSVSEKLRSRATSTEPAEIEESSPEKVLIKVRLPTADVGERHSPQENEKEVTEIDKNKTSLQPVKVDRPKSGKKLFKKPEGITSNFKKGKKKKG